jgi:hypothetical protein
MKIKIGSHVISEMALYRRLIAKLSTKQFGSFIKKIEKDLDTEKKEVSHGHK